MVNVPSLNKYKIRVKLDEIFTILSVSICIDILFQASTIDGRRKGACLFCQEYFMDLYLLAELKTISLKVTTVDMQKPPPDFR